ncbi:hypothetical protein [Acidisoma silvae]|uniref:Uncharacterized protein n=1 Tax=Acidisoma silvae TaxID=2802396 RepID=A0A963YQX0_9PROT|nr:hypothetical protein [Acidisoma silvae]MCB8874932.1 hypothetical protein [Acidisoma silvae]
MAKGFADLDGFDHALQAAEATLHGVTQTLAALQDLLLTAQPPAIADSAHQLDHALIAAGPALDRLKAYFPAFATRNFSELATLLHGRGASDLGRRVETLAAALRAVVTRSLSGQKQAEGLARSLAVSLKQLHATGAFSLEGLLAQA